MEKNARNLEQKPEPEPEPQQKNSSTANNVLMVKVRYGNA